VRLGGVDDVASGMGLENHIQGRLQGGLLQVEWCCVVRCRAAPAAASQGSCADVCGIPHVIACACAVASRCVCHLLPRCLLSTLVCSAAGLRRLSVMMTVGCRIIVIGVWCIWAAAWCCCKQLYREVAEENSIQTVAVLQHSTLICTRVRKLLCVKACWCVRAPAKSMYAAHVLHGICVDSSLKNTCAAGAACVALQSTSLCTALTPGVWKGCFGHSTHSGLDCTLAIVEARIAATVLCLG
jgi:hypothetical protein